ncbi:MAG: hypothetical protein P794_00840 [Epsilonproteobacteria bacterium (ex Lamellibrachia satsuma)]|nr:MAG: hypothetical protein P794_00840 [Epsilonproteobacteria bacterium (ex Lamellibrachia satsuma)]
MKFSIPLSILLLTNISALASSLSVFQNQTIYSFTAENGYIGFAKGVKAKCEGNTIALKAMYNCPPDKRLCKELLDLKETGKKLNTIQANTKALNQLLSLPRPTKLNVSAWVESARLIGAEQANLFSEAQKTSEILALKQRAFQKQAPSKNALGTAKRCPKELELTIPHGYISFSTFYEADILNEKEAKVTQYLSINNRSGIDIEVDTAMFYYRSANQYVNPIHFTPWKVGKYVPMPKRTYVQSMMKEARMTMADEASAGVMPISAPVASYEDAREYKIKNLALPSTGVPLDAKVLTWKAPINCEMRTYPYVDRRVFQVCSFKPKYQIDSSRWKVRSGQKMINESATGEYYGGKYDLYTRLEEDIQVERKPIVQKERQTGIFGGTARKKDGYTLTLINKSDKARTLIVTERIPASTTEEIKVKLLNIRSAKNVDYRLLKDGKIEMKLLLGAHESRKIDILFELSYDKDLKISY